MRRAGGGRSFIHIQCQRAAICAMLGRSANHKWKLMRHRYHAVDRLPRRTVSADAKKRNGMAACPPFALQG
jgi:hypothetical protein